MDVSYNSLWKLLNDKKMGKASLREAAGIAPNAMTQLSRDEAVALAVLEKICAAFEADFGEIKVLFMDDRSCYTVVDRTLNEWSGWQFKNLNAMVWLYRGETDKYRALVNEYAEALASRDFSDVLAKNTEQSLKAIKAAARVKKAKRTSAPRTERTGRRLYRWSQAKVRPTTQRCFPR